MGGLLIGHTPFLKPEVASTPPNHWDPEQWKCGFAQRKSGVLISEEETTESGKQHQATSLVHHKDLLHTGIVQAEGV